MTRFEGQVWTDDTTREYVVAYFVGTRADGWVDVRHDPMKAEVQTTLWFQRIAGSPPWWSAPPHGYHWVRSEYWDP